MAATAARAEEADFKIPETEIILAMQAAVRADDRQWFAAHLHPGALVWQDQPNHQLEGVVLAPLCDDHRPGAQSRNPCPRP